MSLPPVGLVGTWEAERGVQTGDWLLIKHPLASGRAFIRPRSSEPPHAVEFIFQTSEPVSLRVWPLFYRHGDRRPVRRFPYPLPSQPGPDVIDWADVNGQQQLFITSPATGRLSTLGGTPLRLQDSARPGGYLSDMVVDRNSGRIFLADATGERIVWMPVNDLSARHEITTPGVPWSLAWGGNLLYVGTLRGQEVMAVNPDSGQIVGRAKVNFDIAHVDYEQTPSRRIIVWAMPLIFDMATLTPKQPDRDQFALGRRTSAETGRRNTPEWKRFRAKGPHSLLIESFTGKEWLQKTLDTSIVTKGEETASQLQYPLRDYPGPDIITPMGEVVLFTAPLTGKVGIVNVASGEIVGAVSVGGYISDLVADPSSRRAFVLDATGNRLVVVKVEADPSLSKVVASVPVPALPVSVALFMPPGYLKSADPLLFVACWQGKQVVAFSPDRLEQKWKTDLTAHPREVAVITGADPGWWGTIPADRIDLEIRPKLAITLNPIAFAEQTLEPLGPVSTDTRFRRRTSVTFERSGGEKQTFVVDNQLTVQIINEKATPPQRSESWLDVSEVTDPQLLEERLPLTPLDDPGVVKLSVDNGSPLPWRREIWQTPDQLQLLFNDTPEFWRWNAAIAQLPPGRHTVKVETTSPFAALDALKVERVLPHEMRIAITPISSAGEELPARYRSLFYADEPVAFDVTITDNSPQPEKLSVSYQVTNYMGKTVAQEAFDLQAGGGNNPTRRLSLNLRDTGRFTLSLTVRSQSGEETQHYRFIRLPRLEHPRMLLRREDIEAVQARIAQNPVLFRHFFDWLRRRCEAPGFLPEGLTVATFVPKLPEAQRKLAQGGGWRRYDFAWRMIAVQFGALFAPDQTQRQFFAERIATLLKEGKTDYYCTFHHHGPFVPGAVASLVDMVAGNPGQADEQVKVFTNFFRQYLGDMNVLPWTLAAAGDPPTWQERALLWHIGMWLFNVERYFDYHMGRRGGVRWLNPRTGCHCPYAGYGYPFIYLENFLGEPEFKEKKIISPFLTYSELALPYRDNRKMLGPPGPRGEPLKWLDTARSKNPLLKRKYNWEDFLAKLADATLTAQQIDALLDCAESAGTSTPMSFVVPIALALGWYHPDDPEVGFHELPPTILFDVEGEVVMHSDWSDNLTEVVFKCGVRDHVYREQPTHVRISRAGDWLLGTASSAGDDGNPAPGKSWGNVVVIEPSDWLRRWGENLYHPRGEEYCVTNRFSDAAFRYINRDRRLVKYAPAEAGFGGSLDLHGHTESFLVQEGELLAYETWPKFDYAAGDATNSWAVDLADEVLRQVLFLKPDTIIIYDRLQLGPKAEQTRWVAATGEKLFINGNHFLVQTGKSMMGGQVILPAAARLEAFNPKEKNKYSTPPPHSINWFLFDALTNFQQVLEITPKRHTREVEYLVFLKTGATGSGAAEYLLPGVTPTMTEGYAGLTWTSGNSTYQVRFNRKGLVGGDLVIQEPGKHFSHKFVQHVDDSYRHWKSHPLYHEWMQSPRFKFLDLR